MRRRKPRIKNQIGPGAGVMEYYRYKMRPVGSIDDVEVNVWSSVRWGTFALIVFGLSIAAFYEGSSIFSSGKFIVYMITIGMPGIILALAASIVLSMLSPRLTHRGDKVSYVKIYLYAVPTYLFFASLLILIFTGSFYKAFIEVPWLAPILAMAGLMVGVRYAHLLKKLEEKMGGVVYPT